MEKDKQTDDTMHFDNIVELVLDEISGVYEPAKEKAKQAYAQGQQKYGKAKKVVNDNLRRTKSFLIWLLLFNFVGLGFTTLMSWHQYVERVLPNGTVVFADGPNIGTWRFFTALISVMFVLGCCVLFARIAIAGVIAVTAVKIVGWILDHIARISSHLAPTVGRVIRRIKETIEQEGRSVVQTIETEQVSGTDLEDVIDFSHLDNLLRRVAGIFTWMMVVDFLLQFPLYRSLTDLLWVLVAVGILIAGIYAWKREAYWIPVFQDAVVLLAGGSIVLRIVFAAFFPRLGQQALSLFPGWGPDTVSTRVYWYLGFGTFLFLFTLALPKRHLVGEGRSELGHLKASYLAAATFVLIGILLFGSPITKAMDKVTDKDESSNTSSTVGASSRSQPCPGRLVSSQDFRILADKQWSDTGINVTGQCVQIKYKSGRWTNSSGQGAIYTDGNGSGQWPGVVLQSAQIRSIIGKLNSGDTFSVGNFYQGFPLGSGRLFLEMNDQEETFGDNHGVVAVTIELYQ